MPTITIDVAPSIINWIVEQLREDKLSTSIKENLIKWQVGEKKPTFNQIETLSREANIPFGYFFLQEPPIEDTSILEYRTVDSFALQNPSRELIDTVHSMKAIQEWMRNYQVNQGYSVLNFVGTIHEKDNIDYAANVIRRDLGLNEEWYKGRIDAWDSFKHLRTMFENIGILVMVNGVVGQNTHRPLSIQEFRAFTLLDEYAPLIFINSKDSPNGKLFSLLHEAAHIWMGKDNFYNDRYGNANGVSDLEVICNAIAAEILVPNDIFAIEWNKRNDLEWNVEKIKVLSRFFKCGATVIARRALDNKLITKDEYDAIAKEAVEYFNQQKAEKISTGGNFYNNIAVKNDKRFVLALNSSMYEGTTQFTEVYRLTNTNRKTFSKLVEQIRGINYGK